MPRTTVRLLSRTRLVAVSLGAGVAVAVLASAAAAGALPASASTAARDALARVGVTAPNAGGSQSGRAHRALQARPKPFATTSSSSPSSHSSTTPAAGTSTSATTPATTSSTTTAPGHRGDDNASDTAKKHANENSAVHGDKPRPTGPPSSRGPNQHAADAATDAPRRTGRTMSSTTTTTTTTTTSAHG